MTRCIVLGLILTGLLVSHADAQAKVDSLRVMSFNIRYGSARDGVNRWENRKDIVAQVIKDLDPDIVGTQETLDFQAEFLKSQLPDHTYVGRSREANPTRGEQCGILFRKARFDLLASGHFWLSETPSKPGSQSWDSSLPRMATWLQLWDKATQQSFYVVNTHFDHRGSQARHEAAKLLRRFASRLPLAPKHIVVTGDFNAAETSLPYQALFGDTTTDSEPLLTLRDTYRVRHPEKLPSEGTFGGFKGPSDGGRIDWIGCSASFQVSDASIIRKSYQGKYPSDHFPVIAELRYDD